ncbi:MAG: MCE family protein [Bdellovibrionales bacterium]|nr:MCE family protein [Bdellovibrionales bacterium]
MESKTVSNIKAGVFVVIGTIALMISIMLLGGDKYVFESRYSLYVELEQVQGLARGSVVSLAGYPIGNVDRLEFSPGADKVRAYLDLNLEFQNRITENARATVKTQGALGDKYIFVEPGEYATGKPLQDGGELLANDEGDFLDMIAEKGKDIGNVIEVVNETYALLKAINHEGRSAELMQNMVEASREMKTLFAESRLMVKEIRSQTSKDAKLTQALTHLSNVLQKVDRGEGTLGALVNDPTLHEKLVTVLGAKPRNKFLKPLIRDTIKASEDR